MHYSLSDRIRQDERLLKTFLVESLLRSGLLFSSILVLIMIGAAIVLLR